MEDCRYSIWLHNAKDCQDIFAWGFSAELCYDCLEVGDNSYGVLFSVTAFACTDVLYSYCAMRSKHCFGCVGLKRNQYCILNKQYSPEEFRRLRSKIIIHMIETGEWGEFFPISLSPLPYNVAVSDDYFPLKQEAASLLGASWLETENVKSDQVRKIVPDKLSGVDQEAMCAEIYSCAKGGMAHKIIRPELEYYLRNNIAPPQLCWKERHKQRLGRRNLPRLWNRSCVYCKRALWTSYPSYKAEPVLCDSCFLAER